MSVSLSSWNVACRVHTSQFDTECALKLAENLGIGDSLPRLVVLENGLFFVDLGGYVFLREALLLTCSLHCFPYRGSNLGWGSDFVFTVEFGYTLMVGA